MTGQEIVNQVKNEIDQTNEGRYSDSQILSFVNEGYVDLLRFAEMREKQSTTTFTAFNSLQSLPSDFVEARQFRYSYNQQLYPQTERQLDYYNTGWVFQSSTTPTQMVWFNYKTARIAPIPSSAGTIMFRYAYIPSDISLTTEPDIPPVYHDALVDFAVSQILFILREFEKAAEKWTEYVEQREKAKVQSRAGQRTPDTLDAQGPVTVFNYVSLDYGYRYP